MAATKLIILVDSNDHPIGTAEKMTAHKLDLCHRAYSVFVFRKKNNWEVLLQQRASSKYHSANLWTNACCSHPAPNEDIKNSAEERLAYEMGIRTSLTWAGRFHYKAKFTNNLSENEIDHVFTGIYTEDKIPFNPEEAQNYKWIELNDLKQELKTQPEIFTFWFEKAFSIAINKLI